MAKAKEKVEPGSQPLKHKRHELFCQEYIVHCNGAAAWRAATGKESVSDRITACRLLTRTNIQARITYLEKDRLDRLRIDQDKILTMLSDMAHADVTEAYNEDGTLKPLHLIPKPVRLLIEGIEIAEIKERNEDGDMEKVGDLRKLKVTAGHRHRSLELLGKHVDIQAFKEQKEFTGKLTLAQLVADEDE